MTNTVSARISRELHEEMIENCNKRGCSVNDYIKNAIENQLELEASDDEPKEEKKSKIKFEDKKPYYDSLGNWVYWSKDYNDWVVKLDPKNVKSTL